MPLRKIDDPTKVCRDPQHRPPAYQVFEAGAYEWTCPACGHKTYFEVTRAIWKHEKYVYDGGAVETTFVCAAR
jgi:rubredoxin